MSTDGADAAVAPNALALGITDPTKTFFCSREFRTKFLDQIIDDMSHHIFSQLNKVQ